MLTSNELNNLKNHFETKSFKKVEVVFPQGLIANVAYIVLSGKNHLKKQHKTAEIIEHLCEITSGDTFGAWYVLFELELRPVSAEAIEGST